MLGEPPEGDARHDLGGARRPAPLDLDPLQALQETAQVDQQAGQVAADRVEGAAHPPPGRDHVVRRRGRIARAAAVDPRGSEFAPHPGQQSGGCHVPPQPLARLERGRVDQRDPVPAATAHHPGERVLGGVAQDRLRSPLPPLHGQLAMLRGEGGLAPGRLPAQARPPGRAERQPRAGGIPVRQIGRREGPAGCRREASAPHRDPVSAAPDDQRILGERIGPGIGAGLAQPAQQAGSLRWQIGLPRPGRLRRAHAGGRRSMFYVHVLFLTRYGTAAQDQPARKYQTIKVFLPIIPSYRVAGRVGGRCSTSAISSSDLPRTS